MGHPIGDNVLGLLRALWLRTPFKLRALWSANKKKRLTHPRPLRHHARVTGHRAN